MGTPQKILAVQNFVGIFEKFLDFFSSNSEKNIIFRDRFSRKILLNDYEGPRKAIPDFFSLCRYIEILRFSMSAIIYYQNPCKLPVTLYIKAYMLAFPGSL